MNILVTGGAGFIGSHLCERLLKEGNAVIALDNLSTGSENNVSHLKDNPKFKFLRHDIVEKINLDDFEIDQIYNLACPASPVHYQYNPIRTIKTNTIGMINVLGLARERGAKLLQASTSEIYGDPTENPQKESYWGNVNTIGPRACYDEGKRVAETLCSDYTRQHGMDIRIARIFNTYGPKMAKNDGRVISNFITQAISEEPITIYGEGKQTRSFCYISDMVGGLLKLMNHEDFRGPVNLGDSREMTILDIAKKIISLTESSSKIKYFPLPIDDPKQRCPDISAAKKFLSWEPEVSLENGLGKTCEYFRKVINKKYL